MASNLDEPLSSIVEPLYFHDVHGENVRLTQNNMRAARIHLTENLIFTNRPITCDEIVCLRIEQTSDNYQGFMRFGFTTINPAVYTQASLPESVPIDQLDKWFILTSRISQEYNRARIFRFKYTSDGSVSRI
jgi:hypothetical protein